MGQKLTLESVITISENESADGGRQPVKMTAVANSGQIMKGMLIVDLDSMMIPEGKFPATYEHNTGDLLGTFQKKSLSHKEGLVLEGEIYPEAARYNTIVDFSKRGFPWKASIGGSMDFELLERDRTAVVNGQEVHGPLLIGRNYRLSETAVCPCPFDDKTSVGIDLDTGSLTAVESLFNNAFHKEVTMKGNENPEAKPAVDGDSGNKKPAPVVEPAKSPEPAAAAAASFSASSPEADRMKVLEQQIALLSAQNAMATTHAMLTANKLPVSEEHKGAFAALCMLSDEARGQVVAYIVDVAQKAESGAKAANLANHLTGVGGFMNFGNPADLKPADLSGSFDEETLFSDKNVANFMAKLNPKAAEKEGGK